jgi:hypothetical protein
MTTRWYNERAGARTSIAEALLTYVMVYAATILFLYWIANH